MSWTPDLPPDRESNARQIDEKDGNIDTTGRAGSTKTKYKNSIDAENASMEHNNSITHLVNNKTAPHTGVTG